MSDRDMVIGLGYLRCVHSRRVDDVGATRADLPAEDTHRYEVDAITAENSRRFS